jgi:hypothetical protein
MYILEPLYILNLTNGGGSEDLSFLDAVVPQKFLGPGTCNLIRSVFPTFITYSCKVASLKITHFNLLHKLDIEAQVHLL